MEFADKCLEGVRKAVTGKNRPTLSKVVFPLPVDPAIRFILPLTKLTSGTRSRYDGVS
jgi:hypothetical protein